MQVKTTNRSDHDECEEIVRMVGKAKGLSAKQQLLLLGLASEGKPRLAVSLETLSNWVMCETEPTERIVDELEAMGLLTVWRAVSRPHVHLRPVAYQINRVRLAAFRRVGA